MVRLKFSIELAYQVADTGCDFVFNIHAAQTRQQTVLHETLGISQVLQPDIYTDATNHNRYLRLHAAPGPLTVNYAATVDVHHFRELPDNLPEINVLQLPGQVLSYLYPSRYCQSDRLHRLAVKEFGHLRQGYSRVQAIRDWVNQRVTFTSNSSTGYTTAVDTLIDEAGVCRDFAHLMIALCRAVNIPARFVSGIDYGADPALGPTDFHAYVEVYVGHRWYMFDPSGTAIPMGFVRFATGQDAASAAFATMFGGVSSSAPVISIEALPDDSGNLVLPEHVTDALSTAGIED
ncbi:MAG: transglutaminase family protein [Pseudomonadota bacterium]|uniref:transglutaminase-like domain-containing protein n=1 Tax=Polaromonas sp. TaxID=1869339 RepID=UPI001801AFE7|nr:transglutaminase family protein [Polaromonas sp.]MBA3592761.1 transglutaminase family protein [Polaromonas sp.]MDQ3271232.1 transglutaminase family protein [Pseudomonadota bacterium]